jgi:acetoin utilization deacetylase AcuC-like enzyme
MLKIAFNEKYVLPLPEGHRFPMEKYDLLPRQLLHEGTINQENIFSPEPASDEIILTTHTSEYLDKLNRLDLSKDEIRRTGFPLTPELIEREKILIDGSIRCTNYAFEHGVSMNIAGGTHHAFTDRGEGFCILNDQAVAANHLLKEKKAKQILIIDLDVHQGNGTAEIFEKTPDVFTFSMHGEKNYPLKKEISNLDVELPDGIQDQAYLDLLKSHLSAILEDFVPDFIFYQSGVDIVSTDKLGRLGISKEGCKQRDDYVLKTCKELNTPTVVCMGGGYSPDIKEIVDCHANTYRLAQEIYF